MHNKYLVIGKNSLIGCRILNRYHHTGTFKGTSSHSCDEDIMLNLINPLNFNFDLIDERTHVFFLSAISSPDECETNYDRVRLINVDGTIAFIEKAVSKGAKVIFFSSDTVYGERNVPFNDTSVPSPLGQYAKMKYEVEYHFKDEILFKAIRLSYVFSKNDKFTRYLNECFHRNESAKIFHPFFRSVIHIDDVVEGIVNLSDKWFDYPTQVINFGGPTLLSRVDMVNMLNDIVFKKLKIDVVEPGIDFFKNRAKVIAMNSELLPSILGRTQRSLEEAIYLEFIA